MIRNQWYIQVNLDKRVGDLHSYISCAMSTSQFDDTKQSINKDTFVKLYMNELDIMLINKKHIVSIEVWFGDVNRNSEE